MSGRQRRSEDPMVRISKALSSLLRHRAEKEGFKLLPGGFLYLDDVLKHRNFTGVTEEHVLMIVETNDKKRFSVQPEDKTGRLMIRANQGHSMEVQDLELQPITDASAFPVVIHGTYEKNFKFIAQQGLKKMGRNHIHFAAGEPGENGVISGMRQTCSIVIYLDLQKALQAGLQFFLSANNVILSPGNEDGVISPDFFKKVKNRKTGKEMPFEKPSTFHSGSCHHDVTASTQINIRVGDSIEVEDQASGMSEPTLDLDNLIKQAESMTPDELADELENNSKRNRRKAKKEKR